MKKISKLFVTLITALEILGITSVLPTSTNSFIPSTSTIASASSNSAALQSAYFYAKTEHMSKRGVYHQLISKYGDGFSKHSASYAVRHLHGISWNHNALVSARFYRHSEHMSNYAIYHQLISSYGDMFTKSQARYAVHNL